MDLPDLHPVRTPDLGATSPVRVSAWLVEIGESVRAGDRLVELLLPGLTYDVPSPINGQLVEVRCGTNTTVGPGEVLGCVREEQE